MGRANNTLGRNLVIALVIIAIAVIVEAVVIGRVTADASAAEQQLSDVSNQVTEAQAGYDKLKSEQSTDWLTYRNAQGRLSFMGDGSGKVCYLTFDDGPSELTVKNLATLKEKGAVGTWFCLGNAEEYTYLQLDLCKTIEEQGSVVGIHDWDQNDSYDYYKGTTDNYFTTDFDKVKSVLEEKVGHEIKIMRFAGGSPTINYYNSKIGKKLPQELINKGYQYFDWNVLAYDSDPAYFNGGTSTPKDTIVSEVLKQAKTYSSTNSPICVLMHDNPGKETTAAALPEIIDGLKEMGYTFATLSYDTPGFYQAVIK